MSKIKKVKGFLRTEKKIAIVVGIFSFISWSWLLFVKVTDMSSSMRVGLIIAVIASILNALIAFGVFMVAVWIIKRRRLKGYLQVMRVGFIWGLAEFIASLATALIWFGKDASVDTTFPFASLSHVAINSPLVFISRFVGFFGLSAVIAMLIFTAFSKSYRKYFFPVLVMVSIFSLSAWFLYKTPSAKNIKITIASENLGHQQRIEATDADLVVVPEYGLDDVGSLNITERIQTNGKEIYVIGSEQKPVNGKINNLLTFGSTTKGITYQEAKTRLVPGGEYLPYSTEVPLRLLGMDELLINFEVTRAVAKGTNSIHLLRANDQAVFGSAVCSSIISTEDYRKLTRQGATLLTNSASLEIFNGSPTFTWQHTSFAKFMATANARTFAQSSNDGKSFIIDHNGKIVAERWPVGIIKEQVSLNTARTPYTVIGEWTLLIGIIFVGFDILAKRGKKNLDTSPL